jgi:sugar lactone lactonase YvrE
LNNPLGGAVDSAGNLYIVDYAHERIRVVNTQSSSITIAGVTIPAGDIATVAGDGTGGYSGDNGPATSAELYGPNAVAVDSAGNIYIADDYNGRIRKVNTSGTITTVAGNGTGGYSGDGGLATSAELNAPTGVAVDDVGNLFIVDYGNQRIRKVNTSGTITTVAGNGTEGYSGDNGPATSAELNSPWDMAVDSAGNLYIADNGNARIRVVNTQSSSITIAGVTIPAADIATVAGNGTYGYSGDNGPATSAELDSPYGVAVDSAGNVYIADSDNHRIRAVDTSGTITTVAGNGTAGYSGDNGPATSAEISGAFDVVVDGAGNLYIEDSGNNRVRRVSPQVGLGSVSVGQSSPTFSFAFSFSATVQVGSVAVLMQGASGKDFQLVASGTTCAAGSYSAGSSCTVNVTFSPLAPGVRNGAVVLYGATPANAVATAYISGTGVGPAIDFGPGIISTVAGDGTVGYGGDNSAATSAELDEPTDVVFNGAGDLYIADDLNQRIRQVTPAGIITTVAGAGTAGYSGDNGPATSAELNIPYGVVVDGAGNLYIGDTYNHRIREVTPGGIISTVAGNGTPGYNGDNIPATSAELYFPNAVAFDTADNLYIADTHNNRIREVSAATGVITTVAGTGTAGYSGDGGPATSAELDDASGVALDAAGNVYIADYLNNRVRMVSAATGAITTVAGTGTAGYSGDGGPAASAELNTPHDVVVDAAGNLYIADWGNNRVRRVNAATGLITTVVGTGTAVYNGDNITATSADLNPLGMVFDNAGNLYIADDSNARIRKVDVSDPPSLTFATTNVGSVSAAQDVIVENLGNAALNISQISTAANFSLGGPDTTCSSNSQMLSPAASCLLGIEFAPSTAGPISGNVTLTDNALNVSGATQQIPLSGTGQSIITSYTLSLTELGTGTGTVTDNSSPTPLINCSESNGVVTGTCSESYASGTTVVLTASPNSSPAFQGWGGACTVTASNQCSVVMNAAKSVTADFATTYTLSLTELGLGAGTVTDNSSPTPLINCSESNGVVTGTCSASYASGTTVVLTASPNSSPGFGGWSAPPCTVTASNQCSVVMNANQSITADFVAPPASVTLQFTPGTNVTQMATFCPNNSNPCIDPNADALTLTIPQVTLGFSLTVMHTEIVSDGLCPSGGTAQTDFACRLVSFFNYGTDPNGNTIVPLCYRYANGNCVHYLVYSGTPGTEPPTTSYSGGVYWKIGYNNATFVPPGPYWTGAAAPRMLDDPDVDQFSPPLPFGTNCSAPMQVGTPPTQYSPTIYCQFDADITTFFIPGSGLDPIGGKTKQPDDLVVAFLPTSTGSNPVQTPATPTAPTLTGSCVSGCVISGSTITFTEGTGGTFAVPPTGFPTPTLTESGALPNGLTFNGAAGLISGTPADGTARTYSITFTATNSAGSATLSYTLPVNPAGTLTITASSPSMTYGGTVPAITPSYSGFVNGDTIASLTTQPTCSITGSPTKVGTYTTTCSGAADANYSTISYVSGTLTVNPAGTLTITASSPSMTYGGTVPTITASGSGFVNGDTIASLTTQPKCTSSAASSTPAAGTYTTSCSGAADANYSAINYVNGTLTVGQAPLVITASSATMTPGGTVPTITASYSGFVNGNTASSLTTQPTCTTTATSASPPGTYPSSCKGAVDPNYTITYVNGTVTVTASALEISPTSVNFGTLYLGEPAAQFVTLTNKGTTPITISSARITAPGNALGEFGDITFCPPLIDAMPGTLPAGKSCTIAVGLLAALKIFSPTASTATLTLTDSATGSPQQVPLTAQVIDPQATLSTYSLNFGTQKEHTTSTKTVTLTNTGYTPLDLTSIAISGGSFTLSSGTTCASGMMNPSASCTLNVTFTPESKGSFVGKVTITDNAFFSPQVITLAGKGD